MGNYDEWAGRDSIFKNKVSDLRNKQATPGQPVNRPRVPAADQYLQNLVASPQAAPVQSAPAQAPARSQNLEELERRVLYDDITDLTNWRTFMRTLSYELKRGERYKRPLSVCLIAIDGLDNLRAQFGHDTADFILRSAATIVKGAVRDVDIAARHPQFGFAVFLPETNASGLTTVAERIRQKVRAQPIMYAMQTINITASIGAAAFPAHARQAEELVTRANQSLMTAIQRGGDRVCVM